MIKKIRILIIILIIFISINLISQQRDIFVGTDGTEYPEERMALVIGVDDYLFIPDLSFAESDADSMREVLTENGLFTVSLLTTKSRKPTKKSIVRELEYIEEEAQLGFLKTFIFYFAGHGFRESGSNYLATMDIDDDDISGTGLNLDKEVLPLINGIMSYGVKVMVFIDACRNDIGGRNFGSDASFYDNDSQGLGILYSTSEDEYSYEIPELNHGLYTFYLVEGLNGNADLSPYGDEDGYVSFEEISKYVRIKMRTWSLENDKEVSQRPRVTTLEKYGPFLITYVGSVSNDDDDNDDDDDIVLNIPANVSLDTSTDYITINWSSVNNAINYDIYRGTSKNGNYTNIGKVNNTTFIDANVDYGKEYYYKIKAVNNAIESEFSSIVNGKLETTVITLDIEYTDMVDIPGGTYSQRGGFGDEDRVETFSHTISSFSIGKYEVIYELWYTIRKWAESNGYNFQNPGMEGYYNDAGGGSYPNYHNVGKKPSSSHKYHPVTMVSWYDVVVWCNAYSERMGLIPVYKTKSGTIIRNSTLKTELNSAVFDRKSNGFRLPTEGEWQYSASYAGYTPYNYASGSADNYTNESATDKVSWYSENSGGTTHDVGTKAANEYGLYDMSGNVWEWCWDFPDSYPNVTKIDYAGPNSDTCGSRIVRGGSWYYYAKYMQVGARFSNTPSYLGSSVGFRLVRGSSSK